MILWKLLFTVAIWWTANTLTSVVSKTIMNGETETYEGATGWTTAFKDLRWLDLTVLQHLVGTIGSVAWLKVIMNQPLLPEEIPRKSIYMAAVGNVVGNLATNAAYALISSSTTQVIKACEPIFTFGLSFLLLQNHEALSFPTLLSIVTMIIGACLFVVFDTSFNIWGLITVICSNIAFPMRNIHLKELNSLWTNPLQKYAVISAYSVLLLLPAIVIKFASTQEFLHICRMENVISSLSHLTYNAASIEVLQNVSPLTHAILNLSKRVFVILVNIVYFHMALSVSMSTGLLVFFVGLFSYYKFIVKGVNSLTTLMKRNIVLGFLLLQVACFSSLYLSVHGLWYDRSTETQCIHTPRSDLNLKISSAWVFDRPIPSGVIYNFRVMNHHHPDIPLKVYCGASQCVDAVTKLNNTNISAEFLVVSDIVKGTPLENWIARHPLNKILSGSEFENHLQISVQLGILWHNGGIYVDPTMRIFEDFVKLSNCSAWIRKERDGDATFQVSYFPKKHEFIFELTKLFVSEYSKEGLHFDFSKVLSNAYSSCRANSTCPNFLTVHTKRLIIDEDIPEKRHYGTLSYNSRVQQVSSANLGDEIQGIPGLQFVPFIDHFVERDALSTSASNQKVTIFFNAWWGSRQSDWPPPCNIKPIMTSVHIHHSVQNTWAKHINYLRSRSPIGCRDYGTLEFLTKHGIEGYFSGCLTLLTKKPNTTNIRSDVIYLVDVKEEYIKMIPSDVQKRAITIHHSVKVANIQMNNHERFAAGYQLIEKYGSAKLVITQRIHCALPCVAMGTPVIFINSPKLPGGGGSKKESSDRTGGLLPLFHTLDLYSLSPDEAINWLKDFAWESPPPNPNIDLMMRLRATAWNVIRQDQGFYDTAKRFDLLPMSPPSTSVEASHPLFHLIIATSNYTMKMFDHSCVTCDLQEVVQWRSIESIFHHHPLAKVIVHSNTLMQSDFAVLTEAGYSIQVQRYDLLKLLEHTPAHSLLDAVKAPYFHELERYLLKHVILYKIGGIYMDTNIILVHPVLSIETNVVIWQDPKNTTISAAFMKFLKGSRYLNAYLEMISDSNLLMGNTSNRESDIYMKLLAENSHNVHTLSSFTLYSPHREYCTTVAESDEYVNSYLKKAYGVQLNSNINGVNVTKIREGTLCKHLLNAYCVLCNKQY